MTKPKLYVVTTNYDWSSFLTSGWSMSELLRIDADQKEGPLQRLDILSLSTPGFEGRDELEERLAGHRSGGLWPSLELSPKIIAANLNGTTSAVLVAPKGYNELLDIIQMKHTMLDNSYVRGRLPPGFKYFDLIFDFFSNHGKYDAVLNQLGQDFTVQRLEILRPNTPKS